MDLLANLDMLLTEFTQVAASMAQSTCLAASKWFVLCDSLLEDVHERVLLLIWRVLNTRSVFIL